MRVLLDEQLPRQLVPHLVGHEVTTVQQQGWAGLKNGDLLRQADDAGFEVFLTADQNLEFQQNLRKSKLFVAVLVTASNALEDLLPIIPSALPSRQLPDDLPSEATRTGTARSSSSWWKRNRGVPRKVAAQRQQVMSR